jgi:outer membrane PBP1 activator LpoA protein
MQLLMPRGARHLWSVLLWVVALLYGGVWAHASEAPYTSVGQASADPTKAPHIALLLPTGSDAFAKPAEAVRAGFLEAAKKQTDGPTAVRLYSATDDPKDIVKTYREAIAAGAKIIVGPLTRRGVTAVATTLNLITVPTLALNVPEGVAANPVNLYTLSLQVEAEARQVAQLALKEGRRKALTITDQTTLAKRTRDAFVEELQRGGGWQIADYAYATDGATLDRMRQAAASGVADMVFLAVDAPRARVVRPQLPTLPAYGTSQLNPGSAALSSFVDLTDVRFVDMPWMLQADHPAVMIYARGAPRESEDLERLRALGIDAFRVAQELMAGKRDLDIDGVTGRLSLAADGQIRRALPVAHVAGGQLTVVAEPKP